MSSRPGVWPPRINARENPRVFPIDPNEMYPPNPRTAPPGHPVWELFRVEPKPPSNETYDEFRNRMADLQRRTI